MNRFAGSSSQADTCGVDTQQGQRDKGPEKGLPNPVLKSDDSGKDSPCRGKGIRPEEDPGKGDKQKGAQNAREAMPLRFAALIGA